MQGATKSKEFTRAFPETVELDSGEGIGLVWPGVAAGQSGGQPDYSQPAAWITASKGVEKKRAKCNDHEVARFCGK